MDTIDLTPLLAEQLEWHWREQLRPRLEGLSDEEYLWEPVPGCWSLRPRDQATTALAAGAGQIVIDWDHPEPVPAPVTTIAWRIAHIADCFGARAASHFGGPPIEYHTTDWTLSAADGLARLDRTHADWTRGVASLSPADLTRPVGPAEGAWAEHPMADLILHINREVIHHGAEIALLRDLYANRTTAGATR